MYEVILDIIEKNGPISFSSICTEINQIHPIKNEISQPVDISYIKSIVNRKQDLFSVEDDIVSIRKEMDFLTLSLSMSPADDPSYSVFVDFRKNTFYMFEWVFSSREHEKKKRTITCGNVEKFKKELLRIKPWNWKEDYPPKVLLLDGTIWSMTLKTRGAVYKSSGLHTFPHNWNHFVQALSELVGIPLP